MDYWNGTISNAPDGVSLQDIRLRTLDSTSPTLSASSLSYLSLVNTSQIPLHLIAGPRMKVRSDSIDTQKWFASVLLGNSEEDEELRDGFDSGDSEVSRGWWDNAFAQSPTGVLVKVHRQDIGSDVNNVGPKVTELLFYGAQVPEQERSSSRLPSPPLSSPSRQLLQQHADQYGLDDKQTDSADFIELLALPLSSDLLHRGHEPATPPISPQTLPSNQFTQENTATFLPNLFSQVKTGTEKDKKRQRVTELFTRASQRRLKAPKIESSELTSLNIHKAIHKRQGKSISFSERSSISAERQQDLSNQPSQLKRSLSNCTPTVIPDVSGHFYNDSCSKRSSLSRAVSMSNMPSPVRTKVEGLIARNKDVISRVVMAGLRLNGLQPRKSCSRSQRQSAVDSENLVQGDDSVKEERADDISDESFKAMYHMVFKATIHTFRAHISSTQLHQHPEALRDTVEKILTLFSNDPISGSDPLE